MAETQWEIEHALGECEACDDRRETMPIANCIDLIERTIAAVRTEGHRGVYFGHEAEAFFRAAEDLELCAKLVKARS